MYCNYGLRGLSQIKPTMHTVFTRISVYLIFHATSAALIRGRRLFKNCTRQIYFFYIFFPQYTFYLLIFLWTDTKLIVNLEIREKYSHFELKNITFKENKLPMLF